MRVERFFSGLGLAAMSVLLLLLLLVVDLALTDHERGRAQPLQGALDIDMNLVTSDGRRIGGIPGGVELSLSPGTFYENRPGQTQRGVSINSRGLRGAEFDPVPRRRRIIVTGGSAAFGVLVRDEQTFVARLQTEHPEWEFLNAGVVGYLAQQELGLVTFELIDLRPDLIIAFNGWNDVYDPYWWSVLGSGGPPHPGVNVNFLFMENRLVDQWRVRTDPWFALRQFGRTVIRSSTVLSFFPRRTPPAPPPPSVEAAWLRPALERYVASMLKLRDIARSRDCRLLVVVQPEVSQLLAPQARLALAARSRDFLAGDRYYESFAEPYTRFRSQALSSLNSHAVATLDASGILPAGREGQGLFLDPVHLGPAGHAAVARLLAPHVERLLKAGGPG
jgi:hypothetical protein